MTKILIVISWLLLGTAFAFGPEAALKRLPSGYLQQAAEAELAEWEAEFARFGLGGSANVDYGPEWSYGLTLRLSLDPNIRLRAKVAALEAQRSLRKQTRQAVYQGLTLHARAWRAQVEVKTAEKALEEAKLRLKAARIQGRGLLDLNDFSYRVEDAQIALELAEAEHAEVRKQAREAGFSGPAEARVIHFALPDPMADRAGKYRLQQQQAAAARAWRNLVVLSMQARYLGTINYVFEASSVGPDLSFTVQHSATPAAGEWRFGLGARITLDPSAWTAARRAELTAARIPAEQRAQENERRHRLVLLRKRAEGAWKRLQLAQKRAVLAKRRAEQVNDRVAAGLAAHLDALTASLAALRAEAQVASAWRTYLETTKAYLDLANREWRVE